MQPSTRRILWMIFLAATAIRWSYDIALFATMGREGLMGADSHGYLRNAQEMASNALSGNLHGWAWVGSDLGVMPMYPSFLALNIAIFGDFAPLTAVLEQGLVDAGTCLLIYRLARSIDSRIAVPAAIAAAINPTQIVLSGILYTDTLFVFFVAIFLCAAVSWLRNPSWPAAIVLGFGLGLAALDRIVIAPWVPVLAVVLLTMWSIIGRIQLRHVAQVAAAGAIFLLCISPILLRNVTQYGSWSLTTQGGMHLAAWIAPLVREGKDGTPWERGSKEIAMRKVERYGRGPTNPFVQSSQFAEIGREELRKLGLAAVAKAWAMGAAINLAAPAIIISPPIAQLPRTGFFATKGETVLGKIVNFLFRSTNATYAWALLLGIAGVIVIRLIQLVGFYAILRERKNWPIAILLVLWVGFILAANGPIASPKYRLPIEPVMCLLTGAGYFWLRNGRRRLSQTTPEVQAAA